jgi:hypothetical protein
MFKYPYFSGQNVTITLYNNKTEFSTPLSKSYRCAKEQTFDLFGSNNTTGAIKLSHIQLEAFYEKRDGLFDAGLYPIRDMIIFVYILILCTNKQYLLMYCLAYVPLFLGLGLHIISNRFLELQNKSCNTFGVGISCYVLHLFVLPIADCF